MIGFPEEAVSEVDENVDVEVTEDAAEATENDEVAVAESDEEGNLKVDMSKIFLDKEK